MNPEIKAQWVEALRSGEYKQGRHALKVDNRYCCLGVLCDLALKAGVVSKDVAFAGNGAPSPVVEKWAALPSRVPVVIDCLQNRRRLDDLNDSGISFQIIADLIEAQL